MTLNASLRSRVRRLEQIVENADTPSRSEIMRRAQARRLAMSPEEAAADNLQRIDECVDALQLPAPHEHDSSIEARLSRMQRRRAERHLRGLSLLPLPVEPEPVFDYSRANHSCEVRSAWARAQHDREDGRRALALVPLARGHYTPRHTPTTGRIEP